MAKAAPFEVVWCPGWPSVSGNEPGSGSIKLSPQGTLSATAAGVGLAVGLGESPLKTAIRLSPLSLSGQELVDGRVQAVVRRCD